MSQNATIRAAALTGFRALTRSYGLDAGAILRMTGLPVAVEDDPDRRIPVEAVNAAFELAAEMAGIEDFGLRLAGLRGFSNLGPVTVLARDEPDIRSALEIFMSYLPLHNEALDVALLIEGDVAILQCVIQAGGPAVQAMDVAVAMLHRILRQLLGSNWTPEMVSLERVAPVDARHFHHVFGRRVHFSQEFSGIVFDPADLARPNLLADSALRPYTEDMRRSLQGVKGQPLDARVRRILRTMLAHRHCTAVFVAGQLGLSRRSLDRQLAALDTSFHALLNEVRRDAAQGQIKGSARSMTEIAALLGFNSSAAFATWFRTEFDMPPSAFRREKVLSS